MRYLKSYEAITNDGFENSILIKASKILSEIEEILYIVDGGIYV